MFSAGYVISCSIQQPKEYSIDVRIILCTDYRLQILFSHLCQGIRRKLLIQTILNREPENLLCIQSLSLLQNRCRIHGLAGHEKKR